MQIPAQKFISECKKATFYVENDMPIGVVHDFLMYLKGMMVDKMIEAHKQQQSVADAQKQLESESDCADGDCNE